METPHDYIIIDIVVKLKIASFYEAIYQTQT